MDLVNIFSLCPPPSPLTDSSFIEHGRIHPLNYVNVKLLFYPPLPVGSGPYEKSQVLTENVSKFSIDIFSKFLKKVAQKCNKIPNFGRFVRFGYSWRYLMIFWSISCQFSIVVYYKLDINSCSFFPRVKNVQVYG